MSRSAALRLNDTSNQASTETFPFAYPKGTSAWSWRMPGERGGSARQTTIRVRRA